MTSTSRSLLHFYVYTNCSHLLRLSNRSSQASAFPSSTTWRGTTSTSRPAVIHPRVSTYFRLQAVHPLFSDMPGGYPGRLLYPDTRGGHEAPRGSVDVMNRLRNPKRCVLCPDSCDRRHLSVDTRRRHASCCCRYPSSRSCPGNRVIASLTRPGIGHGRVSSELNSHLVLVYDLPSHSLATFHRPT